jgi:hypothetical protein
MNANQRSLVALVIGVLVCSSIVPDRSCWADNKKDLRPRTERRDREQRDREQRDREQRDREQRDREQRDREQRDREQRDREQRDREQRDREQLPWGFESFNQLQAFGASLKSELQSAGYSDTVVLLQGSAVTGRAYNKEAKDWTGERFDVGRKSDFDIALCSEPLLQNARDGRIELRGSGTRTGPLSRSELSRLGLEKLSARMEQEAGRPVNFMIYGSARAATSRGPSIRIHF